MEIVQGGWSATDEACTNYEDMILNMQTGHQFVEREFGVRPRVGWMPDAFGHSTANAAMFADFGFDSLFMARISDEFKEERRYSGELGFIWNPQAKLDEGWNRMYEALKAYKKKYGNCDLPNLNFAVPDDFRFSLLTIWKSLACPRLKL